MTSLPLLVGVVTSWDTAAAVHLAPGAGRRAVTGWVTTWTGSAMSPSPLVSSVQHLTDQTIRDIVYTSVGGDGVRIRVTNAFGDEPLTIGGASVARQLRGARLDPATTHRLTFGGSSSVRVPKGGAALSDPVSMPVPSVSDLAVSLYAPGSVAPATYHQYAQQTNYLAAGDHVGDAADDAFTTTVGTWFLLDAVQVQAPDHGAIVALGDSITEVQGQQNANTRWPNFLARSLLTRYGRHAPAVVDEGVAGNRVLSDSACFGVDLLSRLDRDVFSHADARVVVLLEGINDLGFSQEPDSGCYAPNTDVSPRQLITAYQRIAASVHAHGKRIYVGTLMPAQGFEYWSPAAEQKRRAVNDWLRGGHGFDGVIDFAALMAYPGHPELLDPRYDSGDHLHPNDTGNQAMATAVEQALSHHR